MGRIDTIVKQIDQGEMFRDIDEAYAGGFWDLAGEYSFGDEAIQEALYNVFYAIYESTKGEEA